MHFKSLIFTASLCLKELVVKICRALVKH